MSSCSLISQNNHIARKKTFRNSELNKVEFIWWWGSNVKIIYEKWLQILCRQCSQFWTCFPHFFPPILCFHPTLCNGSELSCGKFGPASSFGLWGRNSCSHLSEASLELSKVKSQMQPETLDWGSTIQNLETDLALFQHLTLIVIYAINFNWERGSLGVDKWLTGWLWKTYSDIDHFLTLLDHGHLYLYLSLSIFLSHPLPVFLWSVNIILNKRCPLSLSNSWDLVLWRDPWFKRY